MNYFLLLGRIFLISRTFQKLQVGYISSSRFTGIPDLPRPTNKISLLYFLLLGWLFSNSKKPEFYLKDYLSRQLTVIVLHISSSSFLMWFQEATRPQLGLHQKRLNYSAIIINLHYLLDGLVPAPPTPSALLISVYWHRSYATVKIISFSWI